MMEIRDLGKKITELVEETAREAEKVVKNKRRGR